MATLYKVRDWVKHYEHADTRRNAGPLRWIAVTTKTDGLGYGRLRQQANAAELLGAWHVLLGVAARQERGNRGVLSRDGVPLSADDLSLMTGFPAKVFDRAFAFFSSPAIAWLVAEEASSAGEPPLGLSVESQQVAGDSQQSAVYITLHNKTGHHKTEAAAVAAPQSDSEWLASLKTNPTYAGIDVDREHGKMTVWCQANRQKPTRRRFVNWLNRAERPLEGGSPKFGKQLPPIR